MKTNTHILPEYYASYLIDGDHSGLEDQEITDIDKYINALQGHIYDCSEESFFTHTNDLTNLGSTCLEFYELIED